MRSVSRAAFVLLATSALMTIPTPSGAGLMSDGRADSAARSDATRPALSASVDGEPSFDRIATGSTPKTKTSADYAAVFGSVSIPFANLPAARKWNEIRAGVVAADFSCDGLAGCAANDKRVGALLASLEGKSFREKLDRVNRSVNGMVEYVPDVSQYGANDVWARPGVTLARGRGDCEDYAILKMAILAAQGIPTSAMSVVVVRDTRRNLYHAVLAVSTSKGHFILDNLRDSVSVDTTYTSYLPLYSLSANRAWIHGRRVGSPAVAAGGLRMDANPG